MKVKVNVKVKLKQKIKTNDFFYYVINNIKLCILFIIMSLCDKLLEVVNELDSSTHFECKFNKGDVPKTILKKLCNCQCCSRHMSCKPEYEMIKIIIENKDKDEIKKIKDCVLDDIVFMGIESTKINFAKSFSDITLYLKDKKRISEEMETEIHTKIEIIMATFYNLVTTFNDGSDIKILCNIFEYKLMNLVMDEKFLSIDENKKMDVFDELMSWCMNMYNDLKNVFYFHIMQIDNFKKGELNDYKNETLCNCNCRHFLRDLLIRYFHEKSKDII